MRIPIYTADLSDKRGFKRIAKKLQRNWPSATPLTLASAQTILSRGLGYRDYHDLQQSAEEDDLHAASATPNEARDGISTSIFAFCQASKITGVDQTDLEGLVKVLPLQELRAFQGFNAGLPADFCAPSAIDTSIDTTRKPPDPSNEIIATQVGQPTNVGLKFRHSVPPIKLIDMNGLKLLWEVVQRRGNLRDQSCFALLLQGLRPNDFKLARPHDFSPFKSGVRMRIRVAKARSQQASIVLSGSVPITEG